MRRARSRLVPFLAVCLLAAAARAEDGASRPRPYLHHPAVSDGGARVAFCWQGDIWSCTREGKDLKRLTDHPGTDTAPAYSPTSPQIAFSSDREGGMDVYVMPASGGPPRRLTFHSADDTVLGFTPFGNAVVFASRRDTQRHRVYTVPLKGGEPSVLLEVGAYQAAFSPDGTRVAFTLGAMAWWRRGYRGAGNLDVWIKPLDGRAERLTDWAGNDHQVLWGRDGRLWFVSDRPDPGGEDDLARVGNLWVTDPDTPEGAERVTSHARHPVVQPSISPDGNWIAYLNLEGGLHLLDCATREVSVVPVQPSADLKEDPVSREAFTDGAGETALSPDGQEVAFAVHGDLFVAARKGGETRRVAGGPSREGSPCWSHDGKALYFVSDRGGSNDIFRVASDEEGEWRLSKARYFDVEPVVAGPAREEAPSASPDGKWLAYREGLGDLKILALGEGAAAGPRLLAAGPLVEGVAWSPDGRWVAFSKSEKDWNAEIYLVPPAGGEAVNVTRDPDEDVQPAFDPKGEYLYFASNRGGGERFNVYRIPLTRRIAQREKEKEEDEDDEEEEGEKAEGEGGKKKDGEAPPEVKVDFEEIEDRAAPVTSTQGDDSLPVLSEDGKTLFFKSNALGHYEIWKSASDGSSLERLTRSRENPEELAWSKKGKELVYRAGGRIRTLSADGNRRGQVSFRAEMTLDRRAEREETFAEAWRALKDYFYDPGMHGADWERCREEYGPWAVGCTRWEDFNDVVSMMLGELNASHLGIGGPGGGRGPEPTGFTGIAFAPGPEGKRYRVAAVLKDSPADREDSKVEAGWFLAAVNREPVAAGDNLSRLFNGTAGDEVDLLFAPGEEGAGDRTVTLKPADPGVTGTLLYEAWVEANRARVEALSGGRLGYIHIRWMSRGEFLKFRREYLAKVRDKEGLVLDVRNNPGGYIHNELWELLSKRRPVGRFRIRGAGEALQPDHTWQKPVVLLINERSASDAEIFPWGFRLLGIGTVVGVPTWGGVIGTGGTRLVNGAWLRLPYVGWYTADGRNLENFGVEPDVRVENHPEDDATGAADAQLERAVKIVLEQLGK